MKAYAQNSDNASYSGLLKVLAGLQFLLAITRYFTADQSWPAVSSMIALSLAMILFSKERVNDERVEQLKLKAISFGLFVGLMAANAIDVGDEMASGRGEHVGRHLSTFDALIMVLVIALGLFHYWRWQDGRPRRD